MSSSDTIRGELQAAGRYMLANGLTWGNSGNLSARSGPDTFVITASGTNLGELAGEDFVECPVAAGAAEHFERKPSKELGMHRAVYAERPDIGAVLHASPLYGTLVACTTDIELPAGPFVEAMYYLERVARVGYRHPGSPALAEGVRAQAKRANVLLLENHGVLVCDTSVKEALMGLHTLEIACRMLITARGAAIDLEGPAPDAVQDFLQRSGYRPPRSWPE